MDVPGRPVRPEGAPDRRREQLHRRPGRLRERARHRAGQRSSTYRPGPDRAHAARLPGRARDRTPYSSRARSQRRPRRLFDARSSSATRTTRHWPLTLLGAVDSPAVTVARLAWHSSGRHRRRACARREAGRGDGVGRSARDRAFYHYAAGRVRAARRRPRRGRGRLRSRARCAARLRPGHRTARAASRSRAATSTTRSAASRRRWPLCRGPTGRVPGRPPASTADGRRSGQYDTVEFIHDGRLDRGAVYDREYAPLPRRPRARPRRAVGLPRPSSTAPGRLRLRRARLGAPRRRPG